MWKEYYTLLNIKKYKAPLDFFGNNKNAFNSLFGSNCTDDNDDSSDDEDDASME